MMSKTPYKCLTDDWFRLHVHWDMSESFRIRPFGTHVQFVIFKPLSYCFEETIGLDVKASFASRPVSRLII